MAFLQKKGRIFFEQVGIHPIFSHLLRLSTEKMNGFAKKDGFPTHFQQIYHIWKFQRDSEILKNSPVKGGLGVPPAGASGPLRILGEDEFFQISESRWNFQI